MAERSAAAKVVQTVGHSAALTVGLTAALWVECSVAQTAAMRAAMMADRWVDHLAGLKVAPSVAQKVGC